MTADTEEGDMTDPTAEAMAPLMNTLAVRAIERAVDAGELDPDLYYERRRDRQIQDMVQADADTRASEMWRSKDEPDDEDEEPGYDSDEQEIRDHLGPLTEIADDDPAYSEMLADMGLDAHDYEERQ